MKNFKVALDGPAGSGKSSISGIVCKKLGFTHIDTGAMFRAITLEALRRNINKEDENEYGFVHETNVFYKDGKTYLNGEDVSKEIRTEVVTNNVSLVSKFKIVRDKMIDYERKSAEEGLIIMDGRDIGTVVLPNADVKIFLNATPEERAKRRQLEFHEKGIELSYEEVLEDIKARDYKDSHREIAPLRKSEDAIEVDTTNMTIDEVVEEIIKIIDRKMKSMEKNSMQDLMDGYKIKRYRIGELVKGHVVQVEDQTLTLDLGTNLEGIIHLDHYTKDASVTSFKQIVKVGDEIEGHVSKVTDEHIFLSRLKVLKDESFSEIIKAQEEGQIISAKVMKEIAGKGYVLNYLGFELFMPLSQSVKEVTLKSNLDVKVLEANPERKRAVVSSKVVQKEALDKAKEEEYNKVNVGDVIHGVIAKVLNYQVYVKFGNLQGVIKAKDVAHEFVDITTILHDNEPIDALVLSKENGKIFLSRKALIKSPFEVFIGEHKVGDKITGKVTNKLPFGLLLELDGNLKGLLHSSEFSHNPNDNFASSVIVGDEVEVAIIAIDAQKEKISLSRKALMDNPWEKVSGKVGDLVNYKVTEVKQNGLDVVALGVDAFIPASETMGERGKELSLYYAKGDEGQAYIIDIVPKEWKLRLSIKKYQVEVDRKSYEKYLENEDISTQIGEQFKDILKK